MKLLHFIDLVAEDLRFNRARDWKAAQLAELITSTREDYRDELANRITGKDVGIVFPSAVMPDPEGLEEFDTVIAVDGATNWFVEKGLEPDVVVTDLDGVTTFPKKPIYVVLLHGDNLAYIEKIYRMEKVVFSTQAFPKGKLILTGGFTDGDRAVALSIRLGAKSVRLLNFDTGAIGLYSKPPGYPLLVTRKLNKLKWAERALEFVTSC